MRNSSPLSANIVVVDGVARIARTNLGVWVISGLIKRGALPCFFTGHPLCLDHLTTEEMFDAWVYYVAHSEEVDAIARKDETMRADSLIRQASAHLPGRVILREDKPRMARFHGTRVCLWMVGYLLRHGMAIEDLLSSFPDLSVTDVHTARRFCDEHKAQVDECIEEDETCDDEDRRTVRILRQWRPDKPTRLTRPA